MLEGLWSYFKVIFPDMFAACDSKCGRADPIGEPEYAAFVVRALGVGTQT